MYRQGAGLDALCEKDGGAMRRRPDSQSGRDGDGQRAI